MANGARRWVFRTVLVLAAGAVVVLAVMAGRKPATVESTRPRRGEIRASFREPARTRLDRTWPITMPVAGRIERIALEPGDPVKAGQELVAYDRVPFETAVTEAAAAVEELDASLAVKKDNRLEETALVQSKSAVDAMSEAVKAASAEIDADRARSERASKELARMEALVAGKAVPQTALDDAALAAGTALISLREKEFNYTSMKAMFVAIDLMPKLIQQYIGRKDLEQRVLEHQLAQARARLATAEHERDLARIVSPIDGVVLERAEQGEQTLSAGQPLLLIGDLNHMEVIADVLTEDALKLRDGSEVMLDALSGGAAIAGKVKRIEPAGFTKLSSLGVEQQRVNVIVAFDERPGDLGVGYRLQATFVTGRHADTLILPRFSVMQSPTREYYVFTIAGGTLHRRVVALGLTSDMELEVLSGLAEGDEVVARPDATMTNGMRVKVEKSSP